MQEYARSFDIDRRFKRLFHYYCSYNNALLLSEYLVGQRPTLLTKQQHIPGLGNCSSNGIIRFNSYSIPTWVLIHELTHWVCFMRSPLYEGGHGEYFCRTYKQLWYKACMYTKLPLKEKHMFVQRRRKRAVTGLFAAFGESMPQVDDFLVMLRQHEEHDPLNDTERHRMWEHYAQLRWPNTTLIPTFPHLQYHQLLPNV